MGSVSPRRPFRPAMAARSPSKAEPLGRPLQMPRVPQLLSDQWPRQPPGLGRRRACVHRGLRRGDGSRPPEAGQWCMMGSRGLMGGIAQCKLDGRDAKSMALAGRRMINTFEDVIRLRRIFWQKGPCGKCTRWNQMSNAIHLWYQIWCHAAKEIECRARSDCWARRRCPPDAPDSVSVAYWAPCSAGYVVSSGTFFLSPM